MIRVPAFTKTFGAESLESFRKHMNKSSREDNTCTEKFTRSQNPIPERTFSIRLDTIKDNWSENT
jgi:hypothetical protein